MEIEKIKQMREELHVSIRTLAKAAGLDYSHLSRVEKEQRELTPDVEKVLLQSLESIRLNPLFAAAPKPPQPSSRVTVGGKVLSDPILQIVVDYYIKNHPTSILSQFQRKACDICRQSLNHRTKENT